MVNTTNYAIPNQHPTSTQDQRHQLDDSLLGLRSTAMLDTATVVSVALFVRCAQAELTSSGLLMLDSTQYVRAITNKFFIRSLWHYRTYVFQTQYTQTASLVGSVHPVSVVIDRDGTPTIKHLSFAVTNTAVSNSNSTGGDSRFFSCDLTRGGHPYVVDQTTTLDGLLPISTMQSRGISSRCELVFALITTTEQPNGHSRHAMAFRIYWRRISRFRLHSGICSYHHRWKTTWSPAPTK
jgi:hypothetical protein